MESAGKAFSELQRAVHQTSHSKTGYDRYSCTLKIKCPIAWFFFFFLHLMLHFSYKGAIRKIYGTDICHWRVNFYKQLPHEVIWSTTIMAFRKLREMLWCLIWHHLLTQPEEIFMVSKHSKLITFSFTIFFSCPLYQFSFSAVTWHEFPQKNLLCHQKARKIHSD